FSHWKHKPLRLCFPGKTLKFVSGTDQIPRDAALVVWGMRAVPEAEARGVSVIRIEDGFLRSVGLGADLIRPLSWVVDASGMYFDSTRPSDLECLLAETRFPDDLLQRAKTLRERIVMAGLTKYNVGTSTWQRPERPCRVVLVPGQVESDASLAYGAPDIKTNLGLLQAVRRSNPDAHILYKPHPDVVAGLRAPGHDEGEAGRWCDERVVDAPMGELLRAVDEVHCLTSLAGFEALLRGKKVVCYGQPFYAGWGLTTDKAPLARRNRSLQFDELVAGALILYPRYMSRKREALVSPEEALDELVEWQTRSGGHTSWWRKAFRVVLRRVVGMR
ncbi:MAG TPA: beta-3-deoxy-D-manno-oct-2-ulosonic acid transferase, partial [Accumulibacter sp.]|nr:beta-3-deoxy-D-manno-oct-2-ulosonic acid transferase [Accumulibacter sp.]